MTSRVVKITMKKLEENGVNPERVQDMVNVAKESDQLQKLSQELFEARVLAEQFAKEVHYHAKEIEEIKECTKRLVTEDIEFLDKLLNINLESKGAIKQLKAIQNVASRRLGMLELIEALSN